MTESKTRKTDASVEQFLNGVEPSRRDDCAALIRLMAQATNAEPKMWGSSIVGFGDYRYTYESGREGDWFAVGFSPRKKDLTLYIMPGLDRYKAQLAQLGPHKTGGSCLYIKRLADVDVSVLKRVVTDAVNHLNGRGQ